MGHKERSPSQTGFREANTKGGRSKRMTHVNLNDPNKPPPNQESIDSLVEAARLVRERKTLSPPRGRSFKHR